MCTKEIYLKLWGEKAFRFTTFNKVSLLLILFLSNTFKRISTCVTQKKKKDKMALLCGSFKKEGITSFFSLVCICPTGYHRKSLSTFILHVGPL